MTTLIVEDGTIITNANTYIDETYFDTYIADRGFTFSGSDKAAVILLMSEYLQTLNWKGQRVDFDLQELDWPRQFVYVEGNLLSTTSIPEKIKKAQCELVLAYDQGYDPLKVLQPSDFVIEEQFAVFRERKKENSPEKAIIQRVSAYLAPYLDSGYGGIHVRVDRSYG